jgi:hypothetical protein
MSETYDQNITEQPIPSLWEIIIFLIEELKERLFK